MKKKRGEGFVQFCGKTPLEIKIGERKKSRKIWKEKTNYSNKQKKGMGLLLKRKEKRCLLREKLKGGGKRGVKFCLVIRVSHEMLHCSPSSPLPYPTFLPDGKTAM